MAADPAVETVKLPNGDLYVGSIADGKPHGQGSRVCVLLRCFALPLCSAALCTAPAGVRSRPKCTRQRGGACCGAARRGVGRRLGDDDGGADPRAVTRRAHTRTGVYTWADGSKYEGEWKGGVKHGTCTADRAGQARRACLRQQRMASQPELATRQ